MNKYFLELLADNDMTKEVNELFGNHEHVTGIHYEQDPNKPYNAMVLTLSFTEEEDSDELFEEVMESIESVWYGLDEVYDTYCSIEW